MFYALLQRKAFANLETKIEIYREALSCPLSDIFIPSSSIQLGFDVDLM